MTGAIMLEEYRDILKKDLHGIFSSIYKSCDRLSRDTGEIGLTGIYRKPFYLFIGAGTSPGMWDQIKRALSNTLNRFYQDEKEINRDLSRFLGKFSTEDDRKLNEIISEPIKMNKIDLLIEERQLIGKIIHNHKRYKEILDILCAEFKEIEESMYYGSKKRKTYRKSLSSIMLALLLLFDIDFPIIFSTNWDTVVETSFEEIRELLSNRNISELKKILCVNDWDDYFSGKDKFDSGIVKLNGCYTERNIVLFIEHEETRDPIRSEKTELVGKISELKKGSFFVIGHGCDYDRWIATTLSSLDKSKFNICWSAINPSDIEKIKKANFNAVSLSAGFVLISLAFTKWLTETGQSDVDNLRNFPDQDYPYKNILSIVSEMIVQDTTTINLFINEGTYLLNKISSLQKKGSLKSKARAYEILRQSLIVYNEKCKKLAEEIAHINEHSKGGGRK